MEVRQSKLKVLVDLVFSEGPFITVRDFFIATLSSRWDTQSSPPVGGDLVA